jgi:Ser/Thr protein kinase RdoA (MazF antagonist)
MILKYDVSAVASTFQIYGHFLNAEPYGTGHINDTYSAVFDQGGTRLRYIFQRINEHVFKAPATLMENIRRVTTHLSARTVGLQDRSRRVLTLIPTREGQSYHIDEDGNYWRAYIFIERARTLDAVESPSQAFEAAKAFGCFQKLLADLPSPRLSETIPDFHHTPKRFAALEQAVEADTRNRAAQAKPEIDFALKHKGITTLLLEAKLPERVTHNDCKLNNVMLDDASGEGICVIDLDTVMPGLALYDFGDMVRTSTSTGKEDECDLSKVRAEFPMFEALVRGYLASASDFLSQAEKQWLVFSGKLITFENGIRFLTDFLAGDAYFKVRREKHNLDRCRTQFKLVESIEQQEEQMNKLLERI